MAPKTKTITLKQRADGAWYVQEQLQFSGHALTLPDDRVILVPRKEGRSGAVLAKALGVPRVWVSRPGLGLTSAGRRAASLSVYTLPPKSWSSSLPVAKLVRVVRAYAARYTLSGSDDQGWTLTRSGAKVPICWRGRVGDWRVTSSPGVRAPTITGLLKVLGFIVIEQAAEELGAAPACPTWLLLARDPKRSRKAAILEERQRLESLSDEDWKRHVGGGR